MSADQGWWEVRHNQLVARSCDHNPKKVATHICDVLLCLHFVLQCQQKHRFTFGCVVHPHGIITLTHHNIVAGWAAAFYSLLYVNYFRLLQWVKYYLITVMCLYHENGFKWFWFFITNYLHFLNFILECNFPHFVEAILLLKYLVQDHFGISKSDVRNAVFNLKCNSITIKHLVAHNFEIGKRIHDELFVSNASNGLFGIASNAGDLLLALHVDDSGEISAVSVPLDANQLCNINAFPIVNAFFINVPNPYYAL